MNTYNSLKNMALGIRRTIAKMYYRAGWGHFAPALSCTDIIVSILFGTDSDGNPLFRKGRDHIILSKGHGCAALYAAFAEMGIIDREELNTFYQNDSRLIGLASPLVDGIDIPTGSLGHGICYATGMAIASQLDGDDARTFVVLGDGESQEGSVWEAAEFAASQGLSNLIVILDKNGLQASDSVKSILPIDNTDEKWASFGWNVDSVNGHSYLELIEKVQAALEAKCKPTLIMANTTKGKGVRISEDQISWHSRAPRGDEWDAVCEDLDLRREELETI